MIYTCRCRYSYYWIMIRSLFQQHLIWLDDTIKKNSLLIKNICFFTKACHKYHTHMSRSPQVWLCALSQVLHLLKHSGLGVARMHPRPSGHMEKLLTEKNQKGSDPGLLATVTEKAQNSCHCLFLQIPGPLRRASMRRKDTWRPVTDSVSCQGADG